MQSRGEPASRLTGWKKTNNMTMNEQLIDKNKKELNSTLKKVNEDTAAQVIKVFNK